MVDKSLEYIENIFHVAITLKAAERASYLAEACGDDVIARQEVESLVSAYEEGDGLLNENAVTLGMRVLGSVAEESITGKEIGSYKILGFLGKGGMGEVYLAEDPVLNRKVALKFLSAEFIEDSWAKRQLIKEAQAVAMLEHPNICAVYGFEEVDEYSFIVMQYVEGRTLAELIRTKGIPIDEVVPLAQQIVSAVAEAHAHGIIHRDIKPKNIMVTAGGQAKVLDFGLAKTIQKKATFDEPTESISQLSKAGLLVGTIAYMSPEQLRGERLDYRSDIFSLGTLLYEMISGKNPFARDSDAETISQVLTHSPPPLRASGRNISPELARVAHHCLEKNKEDRYSAASELLYDLDNSEVNNTKTAWTRFFEIKSVAPLVLLLLIGFAVAFVYSKLTRVYSLAVVPITNETEAANDYLGYGLTEGISRRLASLSVLRVKRLTSVSGFGVSKDDPRAIGQRLQVDAVLTGRIVRGEGSLALESTLTSTTDGSRLWTSRHALTLQDTFTIQEQISQAVVNSLELWVGKGEKARLSRRGTENPEALRLYMLGRYYWRNRDKKNIEKAIESFAAAIKLDPLYAEAHTGLADCYVLRNTVAFGHMTTEEAMTRAKAAAKEALNISPDLPEGHTSLGTVYMKGDWNWRAAEEEFKRAIDLDQDYAPAHYAYSNLLTIVGRQKESLVESKTARDLDPLSLSSNMNFCRAFYYSRDFDRSASCFQDVLKEDPENSLAWYVLGFVDLQKGKTDEALGIFSKLYDADKSLGAAALGYTYAKAGKPEESHRILTEFQLPGDPNKQLPAQDVAIIYLGLGDRDKTFYWLNRACEDRFAPLAYVVRDPLFDGLHSDPRFSQLIQCLKLDDGSINPPKG